MKLTPQSYVRFEGSHYEPWPAGAVNLDTLPKPLGHAGRLTVNGLGIYCLLFRIDDQAFYWRTDVGWLNGRKPMLTFPC